MVSHLNIKPYAVGNYIFYPNPQKLGITKAPLFLSQIYYQSKRTPCYGISSYA